MQWSSAVCSVLLNFPDHSHCHLRFVKSWSVGGGQGERRSWTAGGGKWQCPPILMSPGNKAHCWNQDSAPRPPFFSLFLLYPSEEKYSSRKRRSISVPRQCFHEVLSKAILGFSVTHPKGSDGGLIQSIRVTGWQYFKCSYSSYIYLHKIFI